MSSGFLSQIELKLINTALENLFNACYNIIDNNIIDFDKDMFLELKDQLNVTNTGNKVDFCMAVDALYYYFSILLSEIRKKKRQILKAIFEQKPKLLEEKSVLEKKLDAEPEYANYKEKEEYLFQLLSYIEKIKNTINWLVEDNE